MDSLQASQQTSVEPLDTDEGLLGKSADLTNMAEGSSAVEQHETMSSQNENNGALQHHGSSPRITIPSANYDVEVTQGQQDHPEAGAADSVDQSIYSATDDDKEVPSNRNSEEPASKKLRHEEDINVPSGNPTTSPLSQATQQQQQPQYYRVSGQIVEPGRIKVFTDPTITKLLGLPSSSFIIPTGNFAAPLIANSSVSILLPASQLQLYSRAAVEESQMADVESSRTADGSILSVEHDAAVALAGGHADRSRAPKIVFKPGSEHTISTPMSQAELSRRILQHQQPSAPPTVNSPQNATKENKRGNKRERDSSTAIQQQLVSKQSKADASRKQPNHTTAQPSQATRDAIRRLASGASLYIQPAASSVPQPRTTSVAATNNAQFKKPTSTASSRASAKTVRQSASVAPSQHHSSASTAQQQRLQQQPYSTAAGTTVVTSSQYHQQMMTPAADILCKLNARDIHAVTVQELFDIERRCVSGFKYVNLKQLNGAFVSNSVTGFQNPFMMRQKLQALSRMILNLQPLLIHADLGATLTPPLPLPTPAVENVTAETDGAATVPVGSNSIEHGTENAMTELPATNAESENNGAAAEHSAIANEEVETAAQSETASAATVASLPSEPQPNSAPSTASAAPVYAAQTGPAKTQAVDVPPDVASSHVTADDPASNKAVPALWTSQLTNRLLQACQIFSGDLESILNDLKRDTELRHSEPIKQQLIQHGSPFMTALLRGEDVRKYVLKPIGMYDVSVATSNLVRTPSGAASAAAHQQQQSMQLQHQQQLQQQKQMANAGGNISANVPKPHGNSREARERKAAESRAQQLAAASAAATDATNIILRRQQQQQMQHQQFLQNFPHQSSAARGAAAAVGSPTGKTGKKRQETVVAPPPRRTEPSQENESTSVWTSPQDFMQPPVRTEFKTTSTTHRAAGSRGGVSHGSNLSATPTTMAPPVVTAVTKSGRNVARPKRFQDPIVEQAGGEKNKVNGGLHHVAAAAAMSGGYRSRG